MRRVAVRLEHSDRSCATVLRPAMPLSPCGLRRDGPHSGLPRTAHAQAEVQPIVERPAPDDRLLPVGCNGGGQSRGPTSRSRPSRPTARGWWHPSDAGPNNGPEFQWELDHPLSTGSAADMGSGR